MDNTEEEQTYQFYTIKDEENEGIVDLKDILNLPTEPSTAEQDNNKQIFYLTFDSTSIEEDIKNETDNAQQAAFYPGDVKLITLEDGRMFMTTDQALVNVGVSDSILNESVIGEQEGLGLDSATLGAEDDSSSAETAEDEPGVDYQLVQLADGSQAIIKIYQIDANTCIDPDREEALVANNEAADEEEEEEEEPPKKMKKFQCLFEGCNKFYATSYHLMVHIRSHTDCKPFACTSPGCEKKFSTNYSLKAHNRTHTGEKPYGCTVCTKEFKTSGDLQKHIRIHTGEKPFVCPIEGCGKSFTTSNIRKVHIRSHTGERPYSCTYPDCGKAFTSSTNFKNHLRIHSGEKPYVCQVEGCGKRFTEYSSLYKHNAVHQPVRPHTCLFCGQKFKQESALNFHKRLKHNVVVTKDGTEIIVKIE